ncbi:uncharacterized protein LOC143459744 isoform X2 [Clavelina lepadiformis]|uniref:uncharacterized protein LOC143459744 isoform X2 n=1 Tax=Clavelina lepadiformis TaxID=159417 RepID=UPI0040426C9D
MNWRAAKDPALQKRAKKLIKTWQQMIPQSMQPIKKCSESSANRKYSEMNTDKHQQSANTVVNGNDKNYNSFKQKQDFPLSTVNTEKETSLRTSTPSEVNSSTFTVFANGSENAKTTLPTSASSSKESFRFSNNKSKMKRKRNEDKSSTEESNRTMIHHKSLLFANQTLTKSSRNQFKERSDNGNVSFSKSSSSPITDAKNICLSSTANCSQDNSPSHVSPNKLASNEHVGDTILFVTTQTGKANERSGIDGCRTSNGTWYNWAECMTLKRSKRLSLTPSGIQDPDVLNIFPYVELD